MKIGKSMSRRSMRLFAFLLLSASFLPAGCQTVPLQGGVNERGEKIYLTPVNQIEKAIADFSRSKDISTDDGKINYLIERVRQSKLSLIRNNAIYTSSEAAEFLRWKLNRPRWRPLVHTAQDFVTVVAGGSITSGLSYRIVYGKNEHRNLKDILQNELDFLNAHMPKLA